MRGVGTTILESCSGDRAWIQRAWANGTVQPRNGGGGGGWKITKRPQGLRRASGETNLIGLSLKANLGDRGG